MKNTSPNDEINELPVNGFQTIPNVVLSDLAETFEYGNYLKPFDIAVYVLLKAEAEDRTQFIPNVPLLAKRLRSSEGKVLRSFKRLAFFFHLQFNSGSGLGGITLNTYVKEGQVRSAVLDAARSASAKPLSRN